MMVDFIFNLGLKLNLLAKAEKLLKEAILLPVNDSNRIDLSHGPTKEGNNFAMVQLAIMVALILYNFSSNHR
jgi:hypothetical protein